MTETRSPENRPANSNTWRVLAWVGVALQAIALVFVLWSQKWGGAWTIALFLALSTAFLLMKDRLPSLISFIVVTAALLNAGGWAWNWYQSFAWFDEFIHLFTASAVMSAIGYIARSRGWTSAAPGTGKFILWTAAVGFGLGIVWEVFESMFLNLTFWDTIVDLVMDTLGAAVAGWFVAQVAPERQSARGH